MWSPNLPVPAEYMAAGTNSSSSDSISNINIIMSTCYVGAGEGRGDARERRGVVFQVRVT